MRARARKHNRWLYFPVCLLSPVPTVTGTEIAWFNFTVCLPVSGAECNRYRSCLAQFSCLFASPSGANCDWYRDCMVHFSCLFASPSGSNCDWYRDCLEKKFPCEGTQDGYAIEYADKFCRMFQVLRDRLSDTGQRWMNATRKCLQVTRTHRNKGQGALCLSLSIPTPLYNPLFPVSVYFA